MGKSLRKTIDSLCIWMRGRFLQIPCLNENIKTFDDIQKFEMLLQKKGKHLCSKTIQILIGPGLVAYNLDFKTPRRV
ncbi:hypothetical protein RclHR1_03760002 [Rhizophagus clarus]|uniref:Uncharacterized protein n=1 Tax=Rhizophagus clarus TaxID=94130 RepID=A0A2Z6RCC1_9GLOM|nr:hypothetical protein RclHR1_03760002 [Rhizophagus clarus]